MSAAAGTLESILSPYIKSGYNALFTPQGGYLDFKDNRWSLTRATPRDLPAYYSNLVDILVRSQNILAGIRNLDVFVEQLNTRRTLVLYPNPPKMETSSSFIYFNSKSPGGSNFLSNFFETVVPFRSHNNPDQIALYPSSENAYQAHKLIALARREEGGFLDDRDWIDSIAVASPSDSKKLSQQAGYEPPTAGTAQMKAALMSEVLFTKFRSNPIILDWLLQTGDKDLVEDTSDSFWGSKDPKDPNLQKSYRREIDETSRNVLGRLLVTVRREQPR